MVRFTTPCFHPNVDQHGNICLDILKVCVELAGWSAAKSLKRGRGADAGPQDEWSAAYSVRTLLLSLQSLLGEPNNDSPLNAYAAQLWDNQEEYKEVLLKKYAEAGAQ